jgi:surface carbohydrate biosynthesis protein
MKILYIPIEITKRELNSRLLVSIASLYEGFDKIIIGKDNELFARIKEHGVVLLKSAAAFESKFIFKLKEKGCIVCSLDEEGILPSLNDPSINRRFSKECLMSLSHIFCNGMLEVKSFPNWVNNSDKITIVGNPRFDFYLPEKRCFYSENLLKIRKLTDNKKILLLVSRFGEVNLEKNIDLFELLGNAGFLDSEESKNFHKGFFEHSSKIFNSFIDLPEYLSSNYKDYIIVVRPHPSEYEETWKKRYNKISNILITSEFDIASWLLASKLMIHNSCTTAVESYALNIPCISYKPFSDKKYDLDYSNELCNIVETKEELYFEIDSLLANNKKLKYTKDSLEKFNEIIKFSPSKLSSKVIASEMFKLYISNKAKNKTKLESKLGFFYFKEIIKFILHKLNIRSDYSRKKYGFLSKLDYENKISLIVKTFNFNKVKVNKVGLDLFEITKENHA